MLNKRVTSDGVVIMPITGSPKVPLKCRRDHYIPMDRSLKFFRNKEDFILHPSESDSFTGSDGKRYVKAKATVKVYIKDHYLRLAYTVKATSIDEAIAKIFEVTGNGEEDIVKIQWIGHIG